MVLPLLASYATKKAVSYAKNKAQNQARTLSLAAQNKAKQFALRKTRQVANAARKRVNAGITGLVNKHMGNTPQARALANQLKAHTVNKINMAASSVNKTIRKY